MQFWALPTAALNVQTRKRRPATVACGTILSLGLTLASVAQNSPCPVDPQYRYLRSEEDYSYLKNPACRTDRFDPAKYIPLKSAPEWFASLGGEIREDVEYSSNPRWGQLTQGPAYSLQRFMVHADLHLGERFRFFTQFKSGLENDREGGPRPIDEDKLDVNQAFLDLTILSAEKNAITLRTGRQELAFGSRRYVSAREGPNVHQTFDGFRLIVSSSAWTASLLATKPVQTNRGFFDDYPESSQTFWGLYASGPLADIPGLNLDL